MSNSFILKGYFTKVFADKGQISALLSTTSGFNYNYYLHLPEKETEIGTDAFKKRAAIYQNYINFNTYVVVEVTKIVGKTATGIQKVEVESVKEYAEVRREKAVEILKENFEPQKNSTLKALYLSGLERIAVIEAAEEAEKNWLLNISGHAGERAKLLKLESPRDVEIVYVFSIFTQGRINFSADSRKELYQKVIEYGEAKRQGTAKQSLLCQKYKEVNDE